MELKFYPVLQTNSKRALLKKGKYGNPRHYSPKITLIRRLAREFHMTEEEVFEQLLLEREYLLQNG